jgi:hypothetical protein
MSDDKMMITNDEVRFYCALISRRFDCNVGVHTRQVYGTVAADGVLHGQQTPFYNNSLLIATRARILPHIHAPLLMLLLVPYHSTRSPTACNTTSRPRQWTTRAAPATFPTFRN